MLNRRDELVSKALALFYRHGFQATGMDLLAAETGISKTAIYKHFATKDDLVIATLRLRDEQIRTFLFNRMAELAPDPPGQLLAMFDALHEWFASPDFCGCMFIKASAEYQEDGNPVWAEAEAHVQRITDRLEGLARAAGYSRPAAIARQLAILKEGAIIMATLGYGGSAARDARDIAMQILAERL
ncbi:MAG: TetR family transcriptional regulator [Erythrobacter sp.]|nr:MAG: TetR family transcriptional regulator [Erythrobacter sp.]